MSGAIQDLRKFPAAVVEDLGVCCPECAGIKTIIVSIGDPFGPEVVLEDTSIRTITQVSGVTFASCESCEYSWEIEKS